jgi:hypothetical protein
MRNGGWVWGGEGKGMGVDLFEGFEVGLWNV